MKHTAIKASIILILFTLLNDVAPAQEIIPIEHDGYNQSHPIWIKRVSPTYPEKCRTAGVEGHVTLRTTITAEGDPIKIEVMKGRDELCEDMERSAVKALRQWKFQPAVRNSIAVECVIRTAVAFRLANEEGKVHIADYDPTPTLCNSSGADFNWDPDFYRETDFKEKQLDDGAVEIQGGVSGFGVYEIIADGRNYILEGAMADEILYNIRGRKIRVRGTIDKSHHHYGLIHVDSYEIIPFSVFSGRLEIREPSSIEMSSSPKYLLHIDVNGKHKILNFITSSLYYWHGGEKRIAEIKHDLNKSDGKLITVAGNIGSDTMFRPFYFFNIVDVCPVGKGS